jgi:hypothetical protein
VCMRKKGVREWRSHCDEHSGQVVSGITNEA